MALDNPSTNGPDSSSNTDSDRPGRSPDFSWRGISAWVNRSEKGQFYINVAVPVIDSFPLFPNSDVVEQALEHVYENTEEGGR